jgi:hypothetical protein
MPTRRRGLPSLAAIYSRLNPNDPPATFHRVCHQCPLAQEVSTINSNKASSIASMHALAVRRSTEFPLSPACLQRGHHVSPGWPQYTRICPVPKDASAVQGCPDYWVRTWVHFASQIATSSPIKFMRNAWLHTALELLKTFVSHVETWQKLYDGIVAVC